MNIRKELVDLLEYYLEDILTKTMQKQTQNTKKSPFFILLIILSICFIVTLVIGVFAYKSNELRKDVMVENSISIDNEVYSVLCSSNGVFMESEYLTLFTKRYRKFNTNDEAKKAIVDLIDSDFCSYPLPSSKDELDTSDSSLTEDGVTETSIKFTVYNESGYSVVFFDYEDNKWKLDHISSLTRVSVDLKSGR